MNNKINFYFLFLVVAHISVYGLEFSIHENNSKSLNAIKGVGSIEFDDDKKLDRYISTLIHKKHTAIYLDSLGGSLYGGMRLGRYFKEHNIKTVIQGYKVCASACALAFLGGRDYRGNKWMSSTTTSKLGFHSFSYEHTKYEDMDYIQKVVSDILKYGQDVNADMNIFIKLFSTSSKDMYWFTTQEELNLNIKVWDIANSKFINTYTSNNQTQEDKIDFIKRYFRDLKHVPYHQTYNMLALPMKREVSLSKYKKWWSKSIVSIKVLDAIELNKNSVKVKLLYKMKNGKTNCSLDTFKLQKDDNSWLIYSQKYKRCS